MTDPSLHGLTIQDFRRSIRKYTRDMGSLGDVSISTLTIDCKGWVRLELLDRLAEAVGSQPVEDRSESCESCGVGMKISFDLSALELRP